MAKAKLFSSTVKEEKLQEDKRLGAYRALGKKKAIRVQGTKRETGNRRGQKTIEKRVENIKEEEKITEEEKRTIREEKGITSKKRENTKEEKRITGEENQTTREKKFIIGLKPNVKAA